MRSMTNHVWLAHAKPACLSKLQHAKLWKAIDVPSIGYQL